MVVKAEIVVTGRVQGVGFRWFVSDAATSRGVTGRVWNRADGRVEVRAQAIDATTLAGFIAALRSGPRHGYARIDAVTTTPAQFADYRDFQVSYGPTGFGN